MVDQSTDTEYLVDNQYLSGDSGAQAYFMHALNLDDNGAEEPGFPVEIQGTASNDPEQTFNPEHEIQRPGLLLLGGVVYVGLRSATATSTPTRVGSPACRETGTLTTMWTDAAATGHPTGGGIWQSGGGLVSDGPGTILLTTGNGLDGDTPGGTIPGDTRRPTWASRWSAWTSSPTAASSRSTSSPPTTPAALDTNDLDFGSGSPVALPDQYFGTTAIPSLAVAVGKEGYVYLLNRADLGRRG